MAHYKCILLLLLFYVVGLSRVGLSGGRVVPEPSEYSIDLLEHHLLSLSEYIRRITFILIFVQYYDYLSVQL